MIRSTQAQKAERLRAAQRWLAKKIGMAEAAVALSRENGLSLRQAYRYLKEAQGKQPPPSAPPPSVTISLKMPADLAQRLQAHAAACDLTASEVMRRAVAAYLAARREDGENVAALLHQHAPASEARDRNSPMTIHQISLSTKILARFCAEK
jgi:Ribbon-helix-helix protein, copG family